MGLGTSEVETSSVSRTVPLDCAECQVSSSRGCALSEGPGEGEHGHVLNIFPNWITRWK